MTKKTPTLTRREGFIIMKKNYYYTAVVIVDPKVRCEAIPEVFEIT